MHVYFIFLPPEHHAVDTASSNLPGLAYVHQDLAIPPIEK